MMVENVLEILAKKVRCFTIAYRSPATDNVVGENISSATSGIFIGNQLGKHGFFNDFFTTK